MIKVMTILGTRPEIIRLSRVIPKLHEKFDHQLVHTGQNYDYNLNKVFFNDLELREPDIFLEAACDSPIKTISLILEKIDPFFEKLLNNKYKDLEAIKPILALSKNNKLTADFYCFLKWKI